MKNTEHYKQKGRAAYAAGIVRIPVSSPRGWQQAAERAGYAQAKAEWKAANPGADELAAMADKNHAFCMQAIAR